MVLIRAGRVLQNVSYQPSVTLKRMASLLQNKAYIEGQWVSAASGKSFDVTSPVNGSIVGNVPDMDTNDTEKAILAAKNAFPSWSSLLPKERSNALRQWFNVLENNKEELARIINLEAGKPHKEALGEVTYGNSFIEWFSEEARRIYGEVTPSPFKNKELVCIRQPIGVAGLITPWNFPIAMITRKAGAALAAGCTCVVKPAEDTPLTALAVAKLAEEAGIPKGVFNVVTSSRKNASGVGKLLCQSPHVAGISFTGSTTVGKILYEQCASGIKRIGLELGGNAPFIVFKTADLDKAVAGAMSSKFRNCGQTCVSANRFLVEEPVYNDFVSRLENAMKNELRHGSGDDCNQGPLINRSQLERVDSMVQDAIKKGANLRLGGKRATNLGECFYQPTLLTDITVNMVLYGSEVFGPVVSCIKFNGEQEALRIANDTESGLAGYFFSNDIAQCWRVAKKLEVGMVGINEGLMSCAEAAFGGVKQSGLGREGSRHGIEDYTDIKYMCFGNL